MLSRDREVALNTREARILACVNIVKDDWIYVKDKILLDFFLIAVVYIHVKVMVKI